MKDNLTDFSEWSAKRDDLERVYDERLSYRAVFAEQGTSVPDMTATASGERYAKVILYIEKNNLLGRFNQIVHELRVTYDNEMRRLRLNPSPWGKDDSWICWDLAKQTYYFLNKDPSGVDNQYRVADPLSDEQVRDEIVSRHIGWEFWFSGGGEPWASNPEARRLLGPECENSAKNGQPASWALARLGAIIRSS
jgi:hypothetical protein